MSAEPRVLPLRAPSGEIQWTIVELQGTIEAKAASLDGFHLGDLFERRVSVPRRPPPPRSSTEFLTPARRALCGSGSARAKCRERGFG